MERIAIHGFGRIGRCVLRAALSAGLWAPAAVSARRDAATMAALFEVDTNYGRWPEDVAIGGGELVVGGRRMRFVDSGEGLPHWGELGVDVVIDCTGSATARKGAEEHLERGARRVLVSAPSDSLEDCDAVLLPGINLETYDPGRHRIVSMGSCTTNALAPVLKVVIERYGVRSGFFSTVHAYTGSQSLTDRARNDRRYSWSATENIIPTTSGAAKALGYIWPELEIDGTAYRVPVRTGSIAELFLVIEREVSADDVKDALRAAAAEPPLLGVMGVLEDEWASSRVVGEPLSSLVDLPLLRVGTGGTLAIATWYDNEMGYSSRLAETAHVLATIGSQ